MTDSSDWPAPSTYATDKKLLKAITIPATLLLSKIAKYTARLQKNSLFISPGIGTKTITNWYKVHTPKPESGSSNNEATYPKTTEHKIPHFKVPLFWENLWIMILTLNWRTGRSQLMQ